MAGNEIKIVVTATGAEAAAKVLADVAKSGAQLGSITATSAKQAEAALTSFGASAKRVFEIFTGVNLASVFQQATVAIRDFIVESSKLGREQQLQEATFKSFAASVGVAGDVLAAQIEKVAGGIIDSGDAMKIAMRGLSAGLQPEQIVRLTDAARQLAKSLGVDAVEAYQTLTEAIATGRSRRLEAIGITIDSEAALKKYAASLDKTVEELDTAGRSQATYLAVLEKAGPVIESNRKVADEFGEAMQRLRVAIQDVKEVFGVFVNTTALAFGTWLTDVRNRIPDLATVTQQLGVIWDTTWTNMKATLASLGGVLTTVIVPALKLAVATAATFMVGLNAALTLVAGPLAYLGSLLEDIAEKRFRGMFIRATAEANLATAEARVRLAESVEAYQKLATGTTAAGAATTEMAAATGAGTNALGAMSNQIKPLIPDMKALAAEAEKVADAILKSHVAAAEAAVGETERELAMELEITNKNLADEAKLLEQGVAGWIAYIDAIEQQDWAELQANLKLTDEMLAEQKKALDDVNAGWVAYAQAIEDQDFADLKAIADVNAPLRAYSDTLDDIALKGKLLGSSFDTLAPSIAAVEQEIVRLGKAGQDVTALQEKLAGLKQVQELKGIFTDVFSSIGSAISTSIQGVILGTTTMAKAWDNLWRSIVLSFVNSGVQRLLKGLTDWLWDFFSGTSSGGSGSGIFGAIVSGAGALIAKLAGSGGSGIGPGTGTDPTGAFENVTGAVNRTASALNLANPAVSNFAAGVSAAVSAFGVGAGIYGLTQGGSPASMAFSAGGTALSLYSLAVSASQLAFNAGLIGTQLPTIGVLLAQGLAAVAPTLAASLGTTFATVLGPQITAALGVGAAVAGGGAAAGGVATGVSGVVSSILGSLTPFLDVLAALSGPLAIIGATVFYGLQGIASDAEDAAESWKEQINAVQGAMDLSAKSAAILADAGTQMNQSHLVGTLETLHSALFALGDLDLAVGLNQALGDNAAEGIAKGVPGMRASVGAAWLRALDAAFTQGIAAPTGSPGRGLLAPWSGAVGMQSFDDILAQSAGAGRDGFDKLTNLLEHISQSLDTNLYQVNATGVRMVDIGAVNALLDKEFLTTSLRNAVVDIGALFGITAGQMGGIGAGEGNWRGAPGAGNMPSIAAIASAQAALEAAGFEPGKYAEALEKYLTSIDANLVNNPAWKKFVDMLHKAGGDTGVVAAINAALGKNMTPMQFYGVAKAATDSLMAALKEQMTKRASEKDTDALKAIDDSIAAMTETVKAWSSLVTLYTGLPVEMAAIAGDLGKQTAASIDAWKVQMQSFTDAIADARKELDKAIAGGNITSIAAAAQAVHDQTIAQYNAVLKAVESIHGAIQAILEQAGILVDMMTSVAQLDIRSNGSFATIGSLLGSLQDIAEHGGTAAIRLFAIDKAIQAIIATLPTAIEKFGSEAGPGAITGAVAGAAAPFLAAQQGEINVAKGVSLLALLQQQAQTINALATAAIAGVRQWADAAIKGARAAADEVIAGLTRERDAKLKQIDADIKGIEGVAAAYHQRHLDEIEAIQGVAKLYHEKAMAEIKAIEVAAAAAHDARMAEIDAIQEAEDAAHEYRAAEMEALSELINKAQEIESAVKGMGKFIAGLRQGPLGPGNPMDKFTQAQQSFAQALAAFNRNPTAGGLTDLQDLSQTMLSLAEPIFSKPSPQFQALSATTIKQLMAAQALAAAQMTDSQILKAQLEHLQAIDKATTASVGEQIKAIQAADEAAGKKADTLIEVIKKRDEKEQALAETLIKGIEDLDKMEQTIARAMIKTLEDNRDKVTKDFETQTTAVELGLKNTILAIEKAAADEIDHIQKGTAIALKENMDKQIPLLAAQYDAANAQLVAIGDTKVWQTATLAKLEELRVLLAGSVSAESGMARVTEGLYHLHDDEMVLPKGTADRIRSAEMGAGLPDPTAQAVGEIITNWDKYSEAEKQGIITAYNAADDATKQSADRAASYWQASEAQTKRAATRPPDLSNTGPWAPGSGDPLRDPWMAHAVQTKSGNWIYEPGYGPGATPGSVVKFGTGPAPGPPPPGTAPTAPYLPPGPPWLYRGAGSTTLAAGGSMAYGGGYPDGSGPITVVVKLDGKTIGEATLPTIQGDARSGKMRTIILETKAR